MPFPLSAHPSTMFRMSGKIGFPYRPSFNDVQDERKARVSAPSCNKFRMSGNWKFRMNGNRFPGLRRIFPLILNLLKDGQPAQARETRNSQYAIAPCGKRPACPNSFYFSALRG